MPATDSITDCQRLVESVQNVSGVVPAPLRALLGAASLMMAPQAVQDPLGAVLDAAMEGKLNEKRLNAMLAEAADVDKVNGLKGSLRQRAEHATVERFHKVLRDGAADSILDSLRGQFDVAAEQIAHAKTLISAESDLEHVVESGEPGTIEAWQQLRGHIAIVDRISRVAMQFGVGLTAPFPQVKLYAQAENFKISDQALMCCGALGDSVWFGRPSGDHRTSPFYRASGLKLWTIKEARARYNEFACAEFDRIHRDRPRGGRVIDGVVVYDEPPENPFRRTA